MVQRLPNISVLTRQVSTDFGMGFMSGDHQNSNLNVSSEASAPPALAFGLRECSGLSLGDRMDSGGLSCLFNFPLTPKASDIPANNDSAESFQGSEALASSRHEDMAAPRYDNEPVPLMTREISTTDLFLRRGVSNLLNESAIESSVHTVNDPIFYTGVKVEPRKIDQSQPTTTPKAAVPVAQQQPLLLQREPSRTSERIRTPSNKRKAADEEKPAAAQPPARASKRAKPATKKANQANTRGMHVKERPDMHERARAGQEHWGKMVQDIRSEWQRKRMWEKDEHYSRQISMCTRRHVKSQHECFLRILQMSKIEGVIEQCVLSNDEENSFCGWVSFKVNQATGRTFRDRIKNMFPGQSLGNTLNNAFRRAGLIPEANADETKPRSWEDAWNGVCAFQFHGDKRASYS
jgi:hypothetical protein